MTSETFWTSAHLTVDEDPDLNHHDTIIVMSSADLEQEELNICIPATAPRNPGPTSYTPVVPGVVSHVNQGEHAVGGNAGGQPDGAAPSSSSGAAGGGRDDDPGRGNNRRNANDAELDEESHEAQSGETSSTSSGSFPALINPSNLHLPVPNALWPNMPSPNGNFNNHHHHDSQSEGSGISDATTALISDTVAINSPSMSTASSEVKESSRAHHDNLDVSSAVSTLSPYTTTSSSSGREDRKGLETSRIDISITGGHIDAFHETTKYSEPGERMSDFQISQEDMFACPDERFTSTPSETMGILGFSQPAVNVSEVMGEESNEIAIQHSSEELEVPFLCPTSPTLIESAEIRSQEIGADTRKSCNELQSGLSQQTTGENLVSRDNLTSEEEKKMIENESRASSTCVMADPNTLTESTKDKQHLQKVDPESSASTSHKILLVDGQQLSEGTSILPHDGQKNQPVTADVTPAVSVICKLVFSSSSQSSDTSMSAPEPCTKEFTPIDKPPDECKNAPDITDAISCDRKTVTERQVETPCDSSAIQSKSAALSDVLQQQNTDRNISDSHASTINKHDRAKITNVNSEKPDSDSVWDASNTESHLPPQESPSDFQAPNNAEVTEAELILHYSPSQTAESEYFHTEDNIMQFEVPETELESEECDPGKTQTFKTSYENMMNKGSDTDSGTSDLKSTESDSSMFKSVDDGNPTACPSADANDTKMKVDSSVTSSLSPSFLLNLQQTPPTCRGPIDNKDTFSVEKQCNDYERSEDKCSDVVQQSETELRNVDEVDIPICPVGRHKRTAVLSEEGVTEESQEENIINSPTENGTSSHTGDHAKLSTIHKSCQADLQEIKANESQTKDQSSQTSPFNEATNLKETVGDAIDSKSTIRQTLIIKKVIIKEIVHRGKVIKKTVEEISEEPRVIEFLSPTEKTSPEAILSVKSSSTPSLKSGSSTSGTSTGWMGDISSSKSSSSPSLIRSTPVPSWTPQSDAPFTQVINRGLSGMKTLRSVRRRQCYEIRKNLNLSTPEESSAPYKSPDSAESTSEKIKTTPKRHSRQKRKRPSDAASIDEPCSSTKKMKHVQEFEVQDGKNNHPVETPGLDDGRGQKYSEVATPNPKPSSSSAPNRTSLAGTRIGTLQPGVRVMAKWTDGFYYPGCALEMEKDDRWRILFDDGKDAHSIKQAHILVIDVLPVGQSVYALSSDAYFDSGFIVDHYEDGEEKGYVVEIDGGVVRRVPKTEVILTSDQAACMEDLPRSEMYGYTSICLDNIIEGKRRSRESSASTTPRTPRLSRSTRSKATTSSTLLNSDIMDFENDTTSSSGKKNSHKTHKKRN